MAAASTNELLHDALVRRQTYLASFSQGLSDDIVRLLDATEKDVRLALADRLATLEGRDFSNATHARLNTLANTIEKIRRDAFDGAAEMWDENMRALASAEADFLNSSFKDYAPVVLDTVLPTAELLSALVDTQPLQGRVLAEWAEKLAEADRVRIEGALRIGVAQGEATDDIIRRVIGTGALNGADGVTEITRRDVASITQTAISTIAGEARQAYYGANDDIIKEEVYAATLDSRTTPECQALDGQKFPIGVGPQPPIHWNCRSTRVPVIDGDAIGNRPATSATEDELEGLSRAERAERVAELTGQVPAATTYQEWLGRQSDSFVDDVLGPSRAALFRDGDLPLTRFVNRNGRTYTLDELRAREPDAFRRAGI